MERCFALSLSLYTILPGYTCRCVDAYTDAIYGMQIVSPRLTLAVNVTPVAAK
jgi:hypothetical protein